MIEIQLAEDRCTGCGLCADFCPVDVFEMVERDGRTLPETVRPADCWACDTCVGQCPTDALRVDDLTAADHRTDEPVADPISAADRELCRSWARTLTEVLRLRWSPVAINLIPAGAPLPDVPQPREKLRYCQSLLAARRGKAMLMPAHCHACPDGTTILGLTEIPAKLASGELYIRFGKLATIEAARQMVAERPQLPPRSMQATMVAPLAKPALFPDVIAVTAQPEQMMWLCMAASYQTGHRAEFHVSGYNAQCVETTLLPYTTGETNISLGCYGCRASSDVGDDLMFMGIPAARMPAVVDGLTQLGRKAIGDSRAKIYLPPLI